MENKKYTLLSSLYHDRRKEYNALYESRFNSDECVHLNFTVSGSPAFFTETPGLVKKVVEISRLDKEVSQLTRALPDTAFRLYMHKCLTDEIVITNDIEGIHSTRKEIGEILDAPGGKSDRRFCGLVRKYNGMIAGSRLSIRDSRDIRALYDELFLPEIMSVSPKSAPDGELFRTEKIDLVDPIQRVIHNGVYPEAKIIEGVDEAVKLLNDSSIEPLFRISVFYYLFIYIHPFYHSNGRLNRFIASCCLSDILEPIMGCRLSYTIRENINRTYKSFRTVSEEINKGDITPFIFTFLDFIREAAVNLKNGLSEKSGQLRAFAERLAGLPHGEDEKYSCLYYLLLQASLFSEAGVSTGELIGQLGISRPTLLKRLSEIDKYGLLVTKRRDSNKFYQLKLEKVSCSEFPS